MLVRMFRSSSTRAMVCFMGESFGGTVMVVLRPSNEPNLSPDCGALRTGGEQIMAEAELFQPHRFRSAAAHYLAGRPAYAQRLIRLVARLIDLTNADRMLDLGCGPGMLAGAFAPF